MSLVQEGCRRIVPGPGLGNRIRRARLLARLLLTYRGLRPLLAAPLTSSAALLFEERPETIGAVIWPYQNATWPPAARLRRILGHCREIDRLGAPFVFSTRKAVILADLGDTHPGLKLVMDQPEWFMREGGLTLNLFVGTYRAYSIAFSLTRTADDRLAIYVGAIQGRSCDGALDLYRDLTRSLHGIRPRDFVLDCLRILGRAIGAECLSAVSDDARHHTHRYFGRKRVVQSGYDDIWTDRGGILDGSGSFRLPMTVPRRTLDGIKAKKRALYRRRYDFLDDLEDEIVRTLPTRRPGTFTAT